jgi:hypothetical protein
MLIAATNIGGNNFKNNAMFTFTRAQGKLGIFNFLDGYFAGFNIGYTVILAHCDVFCSEEFIITV